MCSPHEFSILSSMDITFNKLLTKLANVKKNVWVVSLIKLRIIVKYI